MTSTATFGMVNVGHCGRFHVNKYFDFLVIGGRDCNFSDELIYVAQILKFHAVITRDKCQARTRGA
jgi:hypothetical protein